MINASFMPSSHAASYPVSLVTTRVLGLNLNSQKRTALVAFLRAL
jgi:hypothetical protein